VTGGDRGLERIPPEGAAQLLSTVKSGEAATDQELIPAGAVLVEEQDGLSSQAGSGPRARRLDLHQRDQAVDLRLPRDELGQGALGPDDALGHGRLRHQERPGYLLGPQASQQAEGEGDAPLLRQDRMTADEHQAQEVVAHVVVDRGVTIKPGHVLSGLELATELLMLALERSVSPQQIDGPTLPDGHEPGARVVRDA
jgi:hypothetical protein